MKRILWIMMLVGYLFSVSSLVHASAMGFFSDNHTNSIIHSCHWNIENGATDSNTTQDVDCCELVYSNQYSQCGIRLKEMVTLSSDFLNVVKPVNIIIDTISFYKPYLALSPVWNTDIKYQKFSDLVGIIVNLS